MTRSPMRLSRVAMLSREIISSSTSKIFGDLSEDDGAACAETEGRGRSRYMELLPLGDLCLPRDGIVFVIEHRDQLGNICQPQNFPHIALRPQQADFPLSQLEILRE